MKYGVKHKNIYFLGIGGIGMSALAHYFMLEGRCVGGYDRTETAITRRLAKDGATIHYEDDPTLIQPQFREPASTLVVYTPALPADHAELNWFRNKGFEVLKRSEILGVVAEDKYVMAVAGTHGKTTTTTLLAWINHVAGGGGSAFLGGISKNFGSNFVDGMGVSGCAGSSTSGMDSCDGYTSDIDSCEKHTADNKAHAAKECNSNTYNSTSGNDSCNGHTSGSDSCEKYAAGKELAVKESFWGYDSPTYGIDGREKLAVEADEFDRSFLRLHPDVAVITSADADHLDIYGTHAELKDAFVQFAGQIKPGGTLIINKNADVVVSNPRINVYTYSLDGDTDFHAAHIRHTGGGIYSFDLIFPGRPEESHWPTGLHGSDNRDNSDTRNAEHSPYTVKNCSLGIPGRINIENAVAAAAMAWAAANKTAVEMKSACAAATTATKNTEAAKTTTAATNSAAMAEVSPVGWDEDKLRKALASFKGVRRRFDFYINTPELVYMDDYAHHPEELRAVIRSMKDMFPQRRLTVVFQPHLYTRTRDFYLEFADALSLADDVVLVPIYPAREEPIEGVSSQMIGERLSTPAGSKKAIQYRIIPKEMLAHELEKMQIDVLLTAGAGDIENYCGEIADRLNAKKSGKEGEISLKVRAF